MKTRTRTAATLVALLLLAGGQYAPVRAQVPAPDCPQSVDTSAFAGVGDLERWNRVLAELGPRPTASPAHERYIDWIERQLRRIPGLEISSLGETIDRQLETRVTLEVVAGGRRRGVPTSGAVPYSSPRAATGPLVYIPPDTPITRSAAAGKVVVRDVVPGVIQQALFFAVSWYVHDPELSFDYAGNYERDWASPSRVVDLQAAQNAGAAGLVFVHGFPRDQVRGHYAPYTGDHWRMPAVYVGVDEGRRLKEMARVEGSRAAVTVRAQRSTARTRNLVARLPGQSEERIVIQSHTDGMNAVWDNGPVSILALARYFSRLPVECRPRTIEFVFTTAHLYLTHAGAFRYAKMLDETYDEGTTAFVVALEHLGAMEYAAEPRGNGLPGRKLVRTGRSELFASFASESPVLIGTLIDRVIAHDLRRTWVMRGADAPQVAFPPHRSYGGEGGPYREHLIPTVAAITGPWTLFNPAFGMEQIDFDLMRRQTLAFGDLVLVVDDLPREVIAGADTAYRAGRDLEP